MLCELPGGLRRGLSAQFLEWAVKFDLFVFTHPKQILYSFRGRGPLFILQGHENLCLNVKLVILLVLEFNAWKKWMNVSLRESLRVLIESQWCCGL